MNEDLSPVEQARAARWAARWLDQAYIDRGHEIAADHLRDCADVIERSETMESLRAELADTRTDLHKANAEIYRLRSTQVADAWARTRKPVTYRTTGLEPQPRGGDDLAPSGEHWLGGDHSNQTPYPVVRE